MKEYKAGVSRALVYEPNVPAGETRPIYIFYPGMGENDNGGDIKTMLCKHGPLKFIAAGWQPDFYVAGIFDKADFPGPDKVNASIDGLISQLPQVDTTQVFGLGLSAGAQTWLKYVLYKEAYAAKIAGLVVMSPPQVNKAYAAFPQRLNTMPVWAFHGTHDTTCSLSNVQAMYDSMKAANPKHFFLTTLDTGHGPWNPRFDPEYKGPLSKQNIYRFLQANRKLVPRIPLPKV